MADVLLSDDNVLVPRVKMGIEAREQVETTNGLEDAQVTRPDHPLVKYAEMFTHNFDLIAERKSVVYHLRELAKASVLAKYLLESGMQMEDYWFNLVSDISCATCPNVPQLWTKRCHSQIHVQDGKVVEKENGFRHNVNSVYGGVQFGLDRISVDQFRINAVRAAMPGVTTDRVAAGLTAAVAAPVAVVPTQI